MTTASGRYANRIGEGWEDALNDYHTYLGNTGLAVVHKTGPISRMTKQGGRLVPLYVAPGPADYVGCLSGGRAVAIEAKTTSQKKSFTLPTSTLHQKEFLSRVDACGGLAFYLVWWRFHGQALAHPITQLDGQTMRLEDGILIPNGIQWYELAQDAQLLHQHWGA